MKKLLVITFIILTAIIVLPPIIHTYIYPINGDDAASHLLYFMDIDNPDPAWPYSVYPLYYGQYVVGKVFQALPFNVVTSFSVFHYATLIIGICVIGITVAKSVNYFAGILAALLVFGRSFLMTQFYWGVIFDIFNIIILFPLVLYLMNNYQRGIWWKLGLMLSCVAFALFHVSGQYLYGIIPIFIGYEIVRVVLKKYRQKWADCMLKYRYVGLLGLIVICLLIAHLLHISIDHSRILLDNSILIMMLISSVIGLLVANMNWKYMVGITVMAIAVSVPQFNQWVQDNSAIKDVDEQAIEYVNELPRGTYVVSSEITENIYRVYVQHEMEYENTDYIITRSKIMTTTSAIAVKENYRTIDFTDYDKLATFSQDDIEINVYEKDK
jgi:hypothetical protein